MQEQPELWLDFGGTGKNGRYVTLNIDNGKVHEAPDIVCDLRASKREIEKYLKPNSADKARSLHTLEHLPPYEIVNTLRYWKEFLKLGAPLMVVVPNFEKIIEMNHRLPFDVLLGMVYTPVEWQAKDDDHHRWGFSEESLTHYLRQAGYGSVYVLKNIPATHFIGGYAIPNLGVIGTKV